MYRALLAATLLLSACLAESAHGPTTLEQQAAADVPTCQYERATGSLIPYDVCRTPEAREQEYQAKRTWMNNLPQNPLQGDMTYPGIDQRH